MEAAEECEALSHVTLIVGTEPVAKVERAMLANRSPFFEAMFSGSFNESNQEIVHLQDVSAEAVKALVGNHEAVLRDADLEGALDLLQASGMLQFSQAKEDCITFLTDKLTPANSLRILSMADHLSEAKLATRARHWVLWYLPEILESVPDSLSGVPASVLASVLAEDAANIDESLAMSAVIKWAKVAPDNDDPHVAEGVKKLLNCIRWANLNKDTRKALCDQLRQELPVKVRDINVHDFIETSDAESRPRQLPYIPVVVGRVNRDYPHLLIITEQSSTSRLPKPWLPLTALGSGHKLEGLKVVAQGPFIYVSGGEYTMGRGEWNLR